MSKWGYLLETDAEYRKLYRRWLETGSNDSILYSRVENAWLNSADGAQTHFDNDVKKLRQAAPSIGTSVTSTYGNVMRSLAGFGWFGGVYFDIPDGLNQYSHILLYYPSLPSIYVSLPSIYVAPGLDYTLNSKLIPLLRHLFPGRRLE